MIRHEKKTCLLLICFTFSARASKFYLLPTKLQLSEAEDACGQRGSTWLLPSGQDDLRDLRGFAEHADINTFWLGIKKANLNGWKWTNGSRYVGDVFQRNLATEYECAGLSIRDMDLVDVDCAEFGQGVVCQFSGECPESVYTQVCFRHKQNVFLVGCSTRNWFHAREFCREKGGSLAVVDTTDVKGAILDFITTRKLHSQCSTMFIGLHRADWRLSKYTTDGRFLLTDQGKSIAMLNVSFWDVGQPKLDGDCAYGEFIKQEYVWKASKCSNKNYVICQNYNSTEEWSSELGDRKYSVPVIVDAWPKSIAIASIVLFSAGVVAMVSICLWRCISGWLAVAKDGLPRKKIRSSEKCTVVLISTGVDSEHPSLEGVEVKEICWPGEQHLHGTAGTEDASIIAETCRKILSNEKKKNEKLPLRIINIKMRKFPDEMPMKDILLYLWTNKEKIDIVIMPNFSYRHGIHAESQETLKHLKEIKQDTVIVCAPRRHDDIPSREAIGVGVVKGHQTDGEVSGTTDLVVDIETERSLLGSVNVGPATVAGLAAGIIGVLKSKTGIKQDAPKGESQKHDHFQMQSPVTDELIEYVKTSTGMRILLLQIVQKHCDTEELNPYWGFGKLNIQQMELSHTQIVEEAKTSMRNPPRCLFSPSNMATNDHPWEEHKSQAIDAINLELQANTASFVIRIAVVGMPIKQDIEIPKDLKWDIEKEELDRFPLADYFGLEVMLAVFRNMRDRPCDILRYTYVKNFPIIDEGQTTNWERFGCVLDEILKDEYHIVHIYGTATPALEGFQICRKINLIKEKSVLLTCASDILPANFPSESAISVGSWRKGDSFGELTDATNNFKYKKATTDHSVDHHMSVLRESCELLEKDKLLLKKDKHQIQKKTKVYGGPLDFIALNGNISNYCDLPPETQTGSFYATAVVALILMRAYLAGTEGEALAHLRKSEVMHSILRALSSHPSVHTESEGWGIIYPWKILSNKDDYQSFIEEYLDKEKFKAMRIYWTGKNV